MSMYERYLKFTVLIHAPPLLQVYYARAQQMIVLPDIVELDSSVDTLLRLVLESLSEDPLWAGG